MMDYEQDSLERLIKAGIVTSAEALSTDDRELLESLTETEVDQLIALRDRLGIDFLRRHSLEKSGFLF